MSHAKHDHKSAAERLPNKFEACLPVLVLLGLMVANFLLGWGNDPHMYVLMAVVAVTFIGVRCGISYKDMMFAGFDSIYASFG